MIKTILKVFLIKSLICFPNVVEELKEYMATKKSGTTYSTSGSGNMANIRDFEFGEPIGCDGSEEDEFADSCNAIASAKTKCGTKKGPMDKFCKNPENAINRRKMEMLRQMNIRESMDKNEVLKGALTYCSLLVPSKFVIQPH